MLIVVDVRGLQGDTPLHIATSVGNAAMVELLLSQGARTSAENLMVSPYN